MASKPHDWRGVAGRMGRSTGGLAGWLFVTARRVWRPLVYSSAYLAAIAAVEVLVVQSLLSLPPSPAPVVVGLVTFAIYANDRLVDLDTDAASNPYRAAFVRRYRGPLYVLAALSYGLAVALSVLGGPGALALALLPGVAWVLYALGWVPTADSLGRLKEVVVVNSAVVAVAWSLTVVFLPFAFADATVSPTAAVVFAYFALATFVNTEVANVGDVESDVRSGVTTLPVALGTARTRRALYGVVALTAAMLGYATVGGYLSVRATAALAVGLACLAGVIACLGRVDRDTLLTVAAECTRLPVFVLLVAPVAA